MKTLDVIRSALTAALLACTLVLPSEVNAHSGLLYPCGRYQPDASCPKPPAGHTPDYDINAPIGIDHKIDHPICKNTVPYAYKDWVKFKAGDTIQTKYSIGTSHGGGHCQWALSYDGGKTWAVIKTMIRTCLQGTVPADSTKYTIPVQIPEGAPSGNVTLQWIWHNAIGQREIYSNCADLIIEGKNGAQGSVSGVEPLYANYYPDSPIIPEFSTASNPDSHELFDKRRPITITATDSKPGQGNGGSGNDSGSGNGGSGKSGSSTFGPLSRPILPFATAILVPLLGLSGLV